MALPTFRSMAARRQAKKQQTVEGVTDGSENISERTLSPSAGVDLKRATRNRRNAIVVSCLFFLISAVFLILVSVTVSLKLAVLINF